jgi:hypothetical protein
MIGIGINEYVVLGNETDVNDKGTLQLVLKTAKLSETQVLELAMKGIDVGESSTKLLIFGPMIIDYTTKNRKTVQQIVKDMQDYQKQLNKFLEIYLTAEQIKEEFGPSLIMNITKITDINAFATALKSDTFVNSTITSIAKTFVSLCKKYNVFESKNSFRIKLWRQTKEKAYPRIPTGFDTWIESMSVPTPKVVASEYDKKDQGGWYKLDPTPVQQDVVPQETIDTTQSIFSNPAVEELPFIDTPPLKK